MPPRAGDASSGEGLSRTPFLSPRAAVAGGATLPPSPRRRGPYEPGGGAAEHAQRLLQVPARGGLRGPPRGRQGGRQPVRAR
eukprot:7319167-Pyramimonas_sp.AAC.1